MPAPRGRKAKDEAAAAVSTTTTEAKAAGEDKDDVDVPPVPPLTSTTAASKPAVEETDKKDSKDDKENEGGDAKKAAATTTATKKGTPNKKETLKKPQDASTVVTRNGKTWNEMVDCLAEYKDQKGDCYVPDRYKTKDGVCLGLWVRNQRRRKDSLTEEQQKRLTDLGLDWLSQNERFEETWHERYARLTQYRVDKGDCKVPYTYKDDPALAKWVSQQRAQQAQGRLAPDRKAKLDAIDFSWKINNVQNRNTKTEDAKWQKQYDRLVAFHTTHGHCRVPDRYAPDRSLGTWVKKQRLAYACDQLKDERKTMLNNLGFTWRITDKTDGEKWDKMFQKLKEHKEETGSTHISRTIAESDLKPLARWVKTQRALYKSNKILPERKEKLNSISFVWDGTQVPVQRKRGKKAEDGSSGEPKAKRAKAAATTKKVEEKKPAAAAKKAETAKDDSASTKRKAAEDEEAKKPAAKKAAVAPKAKAASSAKDKEESKSEESAPKKTEEAKKVEDEKKEPAAAESPLRGRRGKRSKIDVPTPAKKEETSAEEKDERSSPRRGRNTGRVKYI